MLDWLIPIGLGLLLTWAVLIAFLWISRPADHVAREAIRLLPDTLRLLKRLAVDPAVPTGAKVRLWLLFAYLASPIDLVPDFVPVLGYADDAIIVGIVLRSVVRRSGVDRVRANWPGTAEGLASLVRVAGLEKASRT